MELRLAVNPLYFTVLDRKYLSYQVTDEYGVHLCELALEPSGLLPLRQLSALLLKQYIDAHWSQVLNNCANI